MDNVFRTKKIRDSSHTSKTSELVSGTLDSIHQNIVSSLRDTDTELLDVKINEIKLEIAELENSISLDDILRISKLRSELESINTILLERNPVENYYVRNADIMLKYYGTQEKTQVSSSGNAMQNTFLKYLNNTSNETAVVSKKTLFEQYTARMKLNTAPSGDGSNVVTSEQCETCNVSREEITAEGILVCPLCGSEQYMMVVSDFPSFRDPPKERNNYAYKKINHLNEILNQFQAKESTIIPDEIMHEVVCEIKKRRIQNIADMTEKDIREILKKLNRSKYYEHATHILSRLNGNPPPTITPEIEEKIRAMFQEIQAPFLLYCPDDRTNFLSYFQKP